MTATRNHGSATATSTATSTLADATVDALRRNGVRVVFGIGGTHTLPLLGAIERSDLTFVGARTEGHQRRRGAKTSAQRLTATGGPPLSLPFARHKD